MKSTRHPSRILVLDIGKTHIKLHLLDHRLEQIEALGRSNLVCEAPPYPHFDIDAVWEWLCASIAALPKKQDIAAISITTHGATAALIDRDADGNSLVLPVLDYEFSGIDSCESDYAALRPDYQQTLSPALPLGLNLGKQLFWLQQNFPGEFARATQILMYPQYWSWRFSGALATEVTSLGCHTDLWEPATGNWSSLVKDLDWQALFPPMVPAWQRIAQVREDLATQLGLNRRCRVFAGLHDSNASYLRYLNHRHERPLAVVSTGTWTITMSSDTDLNILDARRDMLANVDINGSPVACSRFMGGREFEIICKKLNASVNDKCDAVMVQDVIDAGVMALPNFSEGSGPFPHAKPGFVGLTAQFSGYAIATLYCALMIDYQLELLQVEGDVFVEGSFLSNPQLCGILAKLRESQNIFLSSDTTGTILGCAMLTQWKDKQFPLQYSHCSIPNLQNLDKYRQRWRSCINNHPGVSCGSTSNK